MKKIIYVILSLCFSLSIEANVPYAFSYQAVVRNLAGEILSEKSVSLRISILKDSNSGEEIYSEKHNVTTNNFGLINIRIGEGEVLNGEFNEIKWGELSLYINLEIDETGGSNYRQISVSQLLAVPYSIYSDKARVVEANSNEINFSGVLTSQIADSWEGKIVNINGRVTLAESVTIKSSTILKFVNGGVIDIVTNSLFKVDGVIEAGIYQIFSGEIIHPETAYSSQVDLSNAKTKYVYPEWFGANNSDTKDDTRAIQCAVGSLKKGGKIYFSRGNYAYKIKSIYIPFPNIHLIGEGTDVQLYHYEKGEYKACITVELVPNPTVDIGRDNAHFYMKDLLISGWDGGINDTNCNLISLIAVSNGAFENLRLLNCYKAVITSGVYFSNFRNISFKRYRYGIKNESVNDDWGTSNNNMFESLSFFGTDIGWQVPLYLDDMGQNVFTNCVVETPKSVFAIKSDKKDPKTGNYTYTSKNSSSYQTIKILSGEGNTFINLRLESLGNDCESNRSHWLEVKTDNNRFINLSVHPFGSTDKHLIYISGKNNEFDTFDVPYNDNLIHMDGASEGNIINLSPNALKSVGITFNWTYVSRYIRDEGNYNLTDFKNVYKIYNRSPLP